MKKYFFFITILFSVNFYVFSAVENISIADGLIFTPNTTINLEPLDEGLNLDDFLISESPSIKLERSDENRLSLGLMMNIKRKAICGININMPPIPGMIPCAIKLVKTPVGNWSLAKALNEAKVLSIKSIGILDHSKMD